ncbi:putative reverse transcriptase domain-containing protein [Tanacetum coccineum]|uniref:Reverse transcriptase domain-containing protein n=1 Tax=Tanacetum coccineum TaxID=301880 RepID=A0ABQ5CH92_9ASTR
MDTLNIVPTSKWVADSCCGLLNEAWFLESKKEWGGRGVKEKNKDVAAKDGVSPSVTVELVVTEKQSSLVDTSILDVENTDLRSYPPLPTQGSTPTGNAPGKSLYANITGKPSEKKVNVRTLFTPGGNGIDVVVLVDSIRAISERFANTSYGFFLEKKVAYPIVVNYVRNTWGKYGFVRLMFSLSTGLFSFQFSFIDGLDDMLDNGPWFIRNNPLILNKWHPNENLLKEDVSTVPVWVKLHGVPVTVFREDSLSAIATKLGTPLMLDSYTSNMCMQSWGRSSYSRVMIELRADVELKDNIVVSMPKITREGHYTCVGEKKTVKKPSQTSRGVPIGPKMGFKPQKEYRPVPKKPNASSSGTPLVPTGIVESDSEVEVVFDEIANLRISMSGKDISDKGYGTNSLLEQWRDSYPDNDDYDPYDDDMYENHDLSEHLQSICDDLDITVHGRKKK